MSGESKTSTNNRSEKCYRERQQRPQGKLVKKTPISVQYSEGHNRL